ncbi:DNA ligase [Pedobacter antarcticus 4BY]|uniref:DNA ligase (ATP) n=2 Tax=Pedobacter antarcticus TaxID=34086 RepID=A0A081PBS0_9SPHI|nr:DNA ligase D [Pedobacter antarcticus]KEQ28143.1 DNA ligase [Pedobacter antarcticus 4BY]SFE43355.1 bifunctional non-homologous end joining protein LigD [Pedobacter antarcticus]
MALEQYKKKRDFKKTTEPQAGTSKDNSKLHFVIQKHAASHLHYDFRLEMEGVLKSWAVPKGPSTDPKTKRLAMMVEDHPYSYKDFEGSIPKGEYGGGTVIVWDHGTYEPIETIKGKKAQDKHLLAQLKAGSLKIKLDGEKLKGEYALVKTHGMGENGWLLIKHKDEYAATADITKKDKSVLSGKTIAEMEKHSEKVWQHGAEEDIELKSDAEKPEAEITSILKKAKKKKIPIGMKPMLATLVDEPFDDPDWLYEVKWDGYRALAFLKKNGDTELLSRNNKQFNERFYPIYKILQTWSMDVVLDGEILVLNEKGISNFGKLQNWRSEADGDLVYYVFDVLWYDGKDLTELPLVERQEILGKILPQEDDRIRQSKVFRTSGKEFFKAAEKMGLEGIIAKKASGCYTFNNRSSDWLKVKVHQRQEVVIAGFTKNENTSKSFSSLLLGVYENGKLTYVGKVGTGFSDQLQREMMAQFKPLITSKSPFEILPDVNKPSRFRPNPPKAKATWLKPELVCEVAYSEVTSDGVFRHPSFKGMREDKPALDVVREAAVETEAVINFDEIAEVKVSKEVSHAKAIKPPKASGRKSLLNPKDETQVRKVCGHELKFTHLSKLYWPEDKVSKRDMFNYYYQVADYILPYLKDRPMSLNRFPGGINGKGFYQKDVKGKAPDWAKTFPYSTGEGEEKEYLVGADEATLLWMASLGCIEMNPWFSRVSAPDNPDYCVIDLDPDQHSFDQVVEAALQVKNILDQIEVPGYCKTSGSTGMHIYIPLAAAYTYEQSQMFAKIIVSLVHRHIPEFTTLERMIKARGGKMYLDFLQNRPGATIAGPYSLRPKPGATVSMPLHWDEVKPGLAMKDFNIFNTVERLKSEGDLFNGVLGKGIDLAKAIEKAKTVFG